MGEPAALNTESRELGRASMRDAEVLGDFGQ
jgi:hypothetical protein